MIIIKQDCLHYSTGTTDIKDEAFQTTNKLIACVSLRTVIKEDELRNPKMPVAKEIVRNNIQTVFPYPVTKTVVDFVTFMYYYPLDIKGQADLQVDTLSTAK